jgi:hypothetical protein
MILTRDEIDVLDVFLRPGGVRREGWGGPAVNRTGPPAAGPCWRVGSRRRD